MYVRPGPESREWLLYDFNLRHIYCIIYLLFICFMSCFVYGTVLAEVRFIFLSFKLKLKYFFLAQSLTKGGKNIVFFENLKCTIVFSDTVNIIDNFVEKSAENLVCSWSVQIKVVGNNYLGGFLDFCFWLQYFKCEVSKVEHKMTLRRDF